MSLAYALIAKCRDPLHRVVIFSAHPIRRLPQNICPATNPPLGFRSWRFSVTGHHSGIFSCSAMIGNANWLRQRPGDRCKQVTSRWASKFSALDGDHQFPSFCVR